MLVWLIQRSLNFHLQKDMKSNSWNHGFLNDFKVLTTNSFRRSLKYQMPSKNFVNKPCSHTSVHTVMCKKIFISSFSRTKFDKKAEFLGHFKPIFSHVFQDNWNFYFNKANSFWSLETFLSLEHFLEAYNHTSIWQDESNKHKISASSEFKNWLVLECCEPDHRRKTHKNACHGFQ
jgi:hypothetical protein